MAPGGIEQIEVQLRAELAPQLRARLAAVRMVVFDFDGVFTDNAVYVSESGEETVRCSRSDGLGLDKLRRLGFALAILSTEINPVVSARARKLKLECVQGCPDKREGIIALARQHEVPLEQVAYMANDINDLPAMEIVGCPVAVADAYEDILPRAIWRSTRPGGHGAVREFCDLLASLH